ncbi:hypothetical protein [Archangium primigenium]|uniref:hypothetical protein n=1 Tax=[Archangium] primigenium TaxID=2792470 RepID=UPI00195AF21A|nr:hypothetical protein [Archangium primigenium]MBM7112851.1 hypothetical protein [Archangium primigenium]
MTAPVNPCVVDTNVPLTANAGEEGDPHCVLACTRAIEALMHSGHIVIDDKFRVLKEYMNKLSPSGQPGVGDKFLKWVLTNQANPTRCTHVKLTPKASDPRDFEEFPTEAALSSFDPSDRKFVAVSVAHPDKPPVLQATDSKWWGLRDALAASGVSVHFLCPEHIEELHQRKTGTK